MRIVLPRLSAPPVEALVFLVFTLVAMVYATQWWLAAAAQVAWWDKLFAALLDWWLWAALAVPAIALVRRHPLDAAGRWPLYALAAIGLVVGQVVLLAMLEQIAGLAVAEAPGESVDRLMRKKVAINVLIVAGLVAVGHLHGRSLRQADAGAENTDSGHPAAPTAARDVDTAIVPLRRVDAIAVRDGDGTRLLPLSSVRYAEAAGNYVVLHTTTGREVVRATLGEVARRLGPGAVRISRSALVRVSAVRAVRGRTAQGDAMLVLDDGHALRLTRTYRKTVLPRLPAAE